MTYVSRVAEMSPEDLRIMQKIELELLLEADRICRKNKIKYNICGGTLIGAVRHKGFIPWDDDIDIRMLRSEYEKFSKACTRDLDKERFFLQDFSTDHNYRWGYSKLLRNGTVYERVGQEDLKMRKAVFIDILVSDGIPQNRTLAVLHNFLCYCIRKVLWAPVGRRVSNNRFIKLWYTILCFIPRNVSVFMIHFLSKLFSEDKCREFRSLTFPQKHGLKKEWFTELQEIEFEDHMVYAPKDFDAWLRQEYGDYMKLPPIDERKGHNTASYYKLLYTPTSITE